MAGCPQESRRRLDRSRHVSLTAQRRVEHGHQLVAHELVDRAIVFEHRLTGDPVETLQQRVKLARGHLLRQRRRAPDISEYHRALDLRPAVVAEQLVGAGAAHVRVRFRRPFADDPHQRAANAGEGGGAEPAPRPVWQEGEEAAAEVDEPFPVREVLAPELLAASIRRAVGRHGVPNESLPVAYQQLDGTTTSVVMLSRRSST